MFHPEDDFSLHQMLALTGELPADLEQEYDLRRRMYCAGGGSGPIGPIALITLARSFNLGPPKAVQPDRLDFRSFPPGKTRVQTKRYSEWCGGVFVGMGDNGQIYVRLDDEEQVREICNRPDVLRLEHNDYMAPVMPFEPNRPALDGETVVIDVPTCNPVVPADPNALAPDYISPGLVPAPAEAATDAPTDDEDDDEPGSEINWGAQTPGTRVWLQDGSGDVQEGVLSHTDESGVFVLIDGAERFAGPYEGLDVYLA